MAAAARDLLRYFSHVNGAFGAKAEMRFRSGVFHQKTHIDIRARNGAVGKSLTVAVKGVEFIKERQGQL